jgi:putative membrane-bound dehydrogenase-like protein
MHYFGAGPVSADYFGKFASGIGRQIGAGEAFVGIMSQGTSGDSHWMDYSQPKKDITSDEYAAGLMRVAAAAYRGIEHRDSASIAMAETTLRLRRRVADAARLEWARKIAEPMGDRVAANQQAVYAREQLILAAEPERELKLQALRIGDLGITAIPNEVYAITGLKLKARSPLVPTMNIELANGSDGYIPPPEQHVLGGYTTWDARTAGLVPEAEPRIVETVLTLLEQVSGKKRRTMADEHGAYAQAVLAAKPLAYWRMNEIAPPTARDASGNGHDARYDWEHGVAFYLLGAGHALGASSRASFTTTAFSGPSQINRAPHFAGGSMRAELPTLGADYTMSCWMWNGLDPRARATTGVIFARSAERVEITGTSGESGRLFFTSGETTLSGKSPLLLKDWHHVALVRSGKSVAVYLDGKLEISGDVARPSEGAALHFAGRSEDGDTLEGRIDEAAVFARALAGTEIAAQYQTSGPPPRAIVPVAEAPAMKPTPRVDMPAPKFSAAYRSALAALQGAGTPPSRVSADSGRGRPCSLARGNAFSVSLWFRNDLGNTERAVTAYLISRGPAGDRQAPGDHLGIGGHFRRGYEGRLLFYNGNERAQTLLGKSAIAPGSWNHVVLVRDGAQVAAYLNGKLELSGAADVIAPDARELFIGKRSDDFAPLQGTHAETAHFDRALNAEEVAGLFKTVEMPAAKALAENSAPTVAPLSPEESLRKIHVPAGWKVELVAAEPMLLDPVAFDWDERGRLWIVEMADYPLGMDNNGKPGGRIRVLEDTDGDVRYDKSTLFADGLNFPNGLLTWRDGVIVTAAPHILFLRDTNGDGRADEQTVLVSGLQEGNQQLRANGLRWGLDNWVYVAAGGHHGKYGVDTRLRSHRTGEEVLVGSRDFRFRPDSGALEPQSGPTQFGRNRDNWGRWFGTQNSNPLWHYVLPDHYLRRNPHVGAAETRVQLLRPANPPVFPASPMEKRFHSFDQSGHFTSACSGMIVRDTRLFPAEEIHALVCEPFHNLAQHARLTDDGVSFTAARVPGEKEFDFFASEDRWCRPVMIREGPDGALWIADMYRYMIEHPQFLPPVGKEELLPHYRAGDDRGRLYRVSREGAPAFRPLRFDKMSTIEVVAALDSPSGWVRDKAQQLLLWRDDSATVAPLRVMAVSGSNPLSRLHALCTLHGLDELQEGDLTHALCDAHPGVRENALRLAETRMTPPILAAAANLAEDREAKVRLQLAFSMGASPDAKAGEVLARLLQERGSDPMMLAAVMSSATPHLAALSRVGVASEPLLQTALGLNDRAALAQLLTPLLTSSSPLAGFSRLLDTLARGNRTLDSLRTGDDALTTLLAKADAIFTQSRAAAADPSASAAKRIAAAALLSRLPDSRADAIASLAAWLEPQHPAPVQSTAVRALGETGADEVPATLAKKWPTLSPALQQTALAAWMTREPWAHDLVQRLQRNELPASALDATLRARLVKHESGRIRNLAAKVFTASTTARSKVVETYQPALTLKGDAAKGRDVFLRTCAACHKRGQDGKDIGPDLISVIEHPPEKLLASILDPNADIQPGFNAYTCTLRSGEQIYGLVAAETANSVTMKLPDATTRTILRTEIAALQSQQTSLMPDGLEAAIPPQDMADLLAFLKGATHGR